MNDLAKFAVTRKWPPRFPERLLKTLLLGLRHILLRKEGSRRQCENKAKLLRHSSFPAAPAGFRMASAKPAARSRARCKKPSFFAIRSRSGRNCSGATMRL